MGTESNRLKFGKEDYNSLELVRSVVFRRLKEDRSWEHLPHDTQGFEPFVDIDASLRDRFLVLVYEVIWELIVQGVLTPGKDKPNLELPWFRVTDYGRKVLEAEKFIPHDPTGYLVEVRSLAVQHVGNVAFAYLEEGLRCFTRGCYIASVLLLGVAAEAVFLDLCRSVENAIRDAGAKQKFANLKTIPKKHRWILSKYIDLPSDVKRNRLPESLDLTLGSLYELIRLQRNDLGHPQDKPPDMNRDQAFVSFRLFPTFVSHVEAFADFCEKEGL